MGGVFSSTPPRSKLSRLTLNFLVTLVISGFSSAGLFWTLLRWFNPNYPDLRCGASQSNHFEIKPTYPQDPHTDRPGQNLQDATLHMSANTGLFEQHSSKANVVFLSKDSLFCLSHFKSFRCSCWVLSNLVATVSFLKSEGLGYR